MRKSILDFLLSKRKRASGISKNLKMNESKSAPLQRSMNFAISVKIFIFNFNYAINVEISD
jgi:hypothetical protein